MEFQDVFRHWLAGVGDFEATPVPEIALRRILGAAQLAGVTALVLESAEDRQLFWRTADRYYGFGRDGWRTIYQAPVIVVLLQQLAPSEKRDQPEVNEPQRTLIAALSRMREGVVARWCQLLMLTAVDQGLRAYQVGLTRPDDIRQQFDIPDNFIPLTAIIVGYGPQAESPFPRDYAERVATPNIHHGRWGVHTS